MFNIVLVEPEIPPNTGNVIRLAANTGCALHLVEPLGFSMEDRHAAPRRPRLSRVRRRPAARVVAGIPRRRRAPTRARCSPSRTAGKRAFADVAWQPGDWLVFGRETAGLPAAVRESIPPAQQVRLPMRAGQRSLNLSNAVAVAVFEAWRQNGYAGGV